LLATGRISHNSRWPLFHCLQGDGLLVVEAALRRIVHRPVDGADGSRLPAMVE
jgi:hypothetical protein